MIRGQFIRDTVTFLATARTRLFQGATMALDFTGLRNFVSKFRNGSPNIARAFDEGEKLWTLVDDNRAAGDADLSSRLDALEGSTTPPPPATSKPSIPTGLMAVSGDGQVALSWAANPTIEAVDGYQVYITAPTNQTLALDVDALTYVATGLANGTTYDFRISAHNAQGYGDYSATPVQATPQGAAQPPPAGFASPLGYLDNHLPGQFPTVRLEDYGVIQSAGPAPAAFRGHNILYRTSITCGPDTYNNMLQAECLANNWFLFDSAGPLTNVGFGGVLGDPGIPAYQQRWAELTLARLQQHGAKGFWADDSAPTVYFISGNRRPTKYPTDDAYAAAFISFMQFQQNYFGSRGLTTGYNSLIPLDDNASKLTAWVNQVGQADAADIITAEYWMAGGSYLRKVGPEWFNNWDLWRGVHKACNTHGIGFFPLDEVQGNAYTLGTFMLDWNGNQLSAHSWRGTSGSDWWIPEYGQAVALGLPTGAATLSGQVWSRPFQRGTLQVNPWAATATFQVA